MVIFCSTPSATTPRTHGRDPWIHKYIFPNGEIPSPIQLTRSIEPLFVMEDWQNFGPDYDRTLLAWHENFKQHWSELKSVYDQRFYRMWTYYLLCFAGVFRARELQLWQLVLSHGQTIQSVRRRSLVPPAHYPLSTIQKHCHDLQLTCRINTAVALHHGVHPSYRDNRDISSTTIRILHHATPVHSWPGDRH